MADVTVYAAIFGNYDTLRPARYPSLCFTDGKMSPVRGWDYKTIYAGRDPKWANRHCKIMVHEHLDVEYSIYHDGNIEMLIDPQEAIERWLQDTDIAVFAHPRRDCVYDEARACIREGKAQGNEVAPQMARYRQEGYPEGAGLAACWVLIRRHTPEIRRLDEAWWAEYAKGAKRDQLGFNYVCWKLGMQYATIPGNLFEGDSEDFRRETHRGSPTVIDYKTAYGQVLLPAEREYLKSTAEAIQDRFGSPTIINIGVFRCASMYCLRAGSPKARIIGVDIKPCDVPIDSSLRASFIIADSAKCHVQITQSVHLLFIDGDHHYRAVGADLKGWASLIPKGGIAIMHDYAPLPKHLAHLPELEGVRRAIDEWAEWAEWERLPAPDSLAAFRRPG